jgi:hypothetical protein
MRFGTLAYTTLALAFYLSSSGAAALAFRSDVLGQPLGVITDLEVAYGARWRVQDRDSDLISPGNGGTRSNGSGNIDDGNLNYDVGPVANMFKADAEITLVWGNWGAFVRAYAFYDYENERRDRARTDLGSEALDQVGSNAQVLDAYLSARFDPKGMPLQLRLGRQVINWGESRFFPSDSANVANPFNLPLFQLPTGQPKDLRLPVGMLWGSFQLSPVFAIEGYYQYEWNESILPAKGTFFSTSDVVTPGATFAQSGPFPDQGTNVDAALGLPPGTVGFVPNWYHVPRISSDKPSDQGQYGISLRMLAPNLNDTSFHLLFANYHSKVPAIVGVTPSLQTYLDYSLQGIAAKSVELQSAGVAPEVANVAAQQIQFNEYLTNTRYLTEYSEDIRMLGLTMNTTSLKTGTALFAEVGHHFDYPMPVVINQRLDQALPGSIPTTPFPPVDLEQITPEEIARDYADKRISFTEELDKTFVSVGATQIFGPRLGASQSALTAEIGWLHVWDFPDADELLLIAPGLVVNQTEPSDVFADANSWGYRLAANLTYNNIFGAVSLLPRLIFTHDVSGNSPSGAGSFREKSKSFTMGLEARYIQRVRADISYTLFQGAGEYNLRNDRDFINFNIRYFF